MFCLYNKFVVKKEVSRGAGAQGVIVKSTGCGLDPHSRKWNIYLNLYFHFFTHLWSQGKARRWIPPFNTQCIRRDSKDFGDNCGIQREGDLILLLKKY